LTFNKAIETSAKDGNLTAILLKDQDYSRLKTSLDDLTYLETLDEDTIYREYKPALSTDSKSPFLGFADDHRDAFNRLKFRDINFRLNQVSSHSATLVAA
jgi:hypothetical protein